MQSFPEDTVKRSPFWFIKGNVLVLMVCRVIWGMSTSIVYPFFSLYILALGGTSAEIGLINSIGILAGMVLYPVGGYIADRAGRVKLVGYSTILYTLTHLFFIFAPSWQVIAVGQFFNQLLLFYMPAMNALEADSLPLGVRGKGFALIMAVPSAIRIVAPYVGGWIITGYGGGDEGMVQAIRLCWGIATLTGFVVSWLRIRYLKETIEGGSTGSFKLSEVPRTLFNSYASIVESFHWMNKSLRYLVLVEIIASFAVALSSPFWVVYATEIFGLSAYDWGVVLLISGIVGILVAFPMGSLVDKIGPRKMILLGLVLTPPLVVLFQFAGGFIGVVIVVAGISVVNNIMMPAFSTIIANSIPRERRGRLYSILGERGISINFGNFWGGGVLLFPPAALGAFLGGHLYALNPAYPTIILAGVMVVALVIAYLYLHEPEKDHQ